MTALLTRTARRLLLLIVGLQAAVLLAWWVPVFGGGPLPLVAHRGDLAEWPENTREAILSAANGGAAGVEIDVRRSSDGVWFVFHDDLLERLTGQEGEFDALTAAEVRQLRITGGLGYSEASFAGRSFVVPELAAILEALNDYGGQLILDVKSKVPADYENLAGMVAGRRVIVICRIAAGASALKAVDPALPTAALVTVSPREGIDYRLLDARIQVRTPVDIWLGGPAIVFENQTEFGRPNEEWLRRADTWGAAFMIVNELQ